MPASLTKSLVEAACALLCSAIVSLVLTRSLLTLLPKWGMMDQPDHKRKINVRPVPRGGGIGMATAFIAVTITAFLALPEYSERSATALKMLLPLAILLPLGVLDDRFTLSAKVKFLFQFATAALAWWLGFRMRSLFGWSLPAWLSCPLTLFWIVGLINAFNMIDGVDGLAGGVGLISACSIAIVAFCHRDASMGLLLAAFCGSLLGFLRYNWHPARLFMGDTGSMFIGYILAVSGLLFNARIASVVSILVPLLAFGIPVIDISLAVWRRVVGAPAPTSDALDAAPAPQERPGFLKRLARLLARLGTATRSTSTTDFCAITATTSARPSGASTGWAPSWARRASPAATYLRRT